MIEHRELTALEAEEILTEHYDDHAHIGQFVAASERFIGTFASDECLGVFGAARVSLLSNQGYCWFCETENLHHHRRGFARSSRRVVQLLHQTFVDLVGLTRGTSIRWLAFMGAEFGPVTTDGWTPFIFRRAE